MDTHIGGHLLVIVELNPASARDFLNSWPATQLDLAVDDELRGADIDA